MHPLSSHLPTLPLPIAPPLPHLWSFNLQVRRRWHLMLKVVPDHRDVAFQEQVCVWADRVKSWVVLGACARLRLTTAM